jgi:rhodanese-related sulfurtransferase
VPQYTVDERKWEDFKVQRDQVTSVSTQPKGNVEEPFTRIDVATAQRMIANREVRVIDVREPGEYAEGHLPGVKLIPLNTLMAQPHKYLTEDNVLFVCQMGSRSAVACEMAAAVGLEHIYNLEGGTSAWTKAGLPIDK